jgi:hypothetical protein
MSWCDTCDAFVSSDSKTIMGFPHVCPPEWKVWRSNDGETEEDAVTVRAYTAAGAAEKWADEHNRNGDYEIMGYDSPATVMVRPADESEEAVRLEVTGEMVPHYTAREAE